MNPQNRIVSDTGPLITLEKLPDGYPFIRKLYGQILIPTTVLEELYLGQFDNPQAYLTYYNVTDLLVVADVEPSPLPGLDRLDRGERDAIRLALQRRLPLLIEEEAGRQIASQLGLTISGIAGQILRAFRSKILTSPEALEKLRMLFTARRINTRIYQGLVDAIRRDSPREK